MRPILARVLPGWISDHDVLAPMADPAAVLAEALILLLRAMSADGAVLLIDDVHWADEDTVSVLSYLADSLDQLPLALIMTARSEPLLPEPLGRLSAAPSIRQLRLSRLQAPEVADALRAQEFPGLAPETVAQLVTAVDGLPLILDEFVRQLRENPTNAIDMKHTTLAAAVQKRLRSLPPDARVVLDAMSVLGDTDSELLTVITELDDAKLSTAIHHAVSSTLLVSATTPLGVMWRHPLMRDAVRDLLLPLEQQTLARRAADHLVNRSTEPTEGQLRQAAEMYELARYPDRAARELIRAARAAVRGAALDVAEHHLTAAHALTGTLPDAALDVLIERIDTLTLAGRAADGYHSGIAALQSAAAGDSRRLLVATTRAAYSAGLRAEAAPLLARLEQVAEPTDSDLMVLRADAAWAYRKSEAIQLGQLAAARALDEGRFELACEALLVAGTAAQRRDIDLAARILHQALALSEAHQLSIWQVQALAELGVVDLATDSDPTRDYQARERATAAGMLGTVAVIDTQIGAATAFREGFLAAYPIYLRADAQARQLQLTGPYAVTRAHLALCVLFVDDRPLPGRTRPAAPSEFDDLIAEALAAGKKSGRAPWARSLYGLRAWLHGDNSTAIRLIDESTTRRMAPHTVVGSWGTAARRRWHRPRGGVRLARTDRTPRQLGGARLRHGRLGASKRAISVRVDRRSRSPRSAHSAPPPHAAYDHRTGCLPSGHEVGGRGLAARGRRILQCGRRTRPATSGPPHARLGRRQSPEGFKSDGPTTPGQTRDHRTRGRDSAARQRRPEQCRHLPSPVHIDQNRGVPRQQHAAKDRPHHQGTVAVSQYR